MARSVAPRHSLTIVIPAFNESRHIGATLRAAADAVRRSRFDADFVVIDDGSTDGTADAARAAGIEYPLSVISGPNRGRVPARRAGLEAATGEYTFFLDSRVLLDPEGLAFVADRIDRGELVWNGHLVIDTAGNPYAKFWKVVTHVAWAEYLGNPRPVAFDTTNFDNYPKGSGCFLAPTSMLREAFGGLQSYFADERNAADDTPSIRWIAARHPIRISPQFACSYTARTTLRGFVKQAFHRGAFFLDGHGRRESRFFPVVVAFYPVSVLSLLVTLRRPWLALAAATGGIAGAGLFARRRGFSVDESVAFAVIAPLYVAVHGIGMWRGLALMLAARARRGQSSS